MSLNKILGKLGEHREKYLLHNQKITCFYICIFQRSFSSTYSLRLTMLAFALQEKMCARQPRLILWKTNCDDRLEGLQKDFTSQLNTIEDQVQEINEKGLQLTRAVNRLAEIISHIASKQDDFQNLQFAVNRELLEQQIANSRMIIENRKIALSINAIDTQREIEEYNTV